MSPWSADAANWEITPSATVEEAFTDNLGLRRDSEDRNSDLTTTLTPGIAIRGNGARINLNADYTHSRLMHMRASDQNSSLNNLNAAASAEVWEHAVFIDGGAQISQQVANTQAPVSQSSANIGVNRLETTSWNVAPRFLHHFGTWAETTSIISHRAISTDRGDESGGPNGATSGTVTGAPPVRNSVVDTSSFVMQSGRRFTTLLWSATASNTRTSSDQAPHHTDKLGRVDLTYVVNRKLSINGGGGIQIINDQALANSPHGPIWTIGATYRPGPRTTLRFAYNSQFDDQFFTYSGTYNVSPRTTISFDHSQSITTTPQLIAQRAPIFDPLTGVFRDPLTGQPIDPLTNPPGLENDTLRQKTWNANFASSSGRSSYSLTFNRTETKVERTGQVTTQNGIVATFSRTLSRRLNGTLSANYRIGETTDATGAPTGAIPGATATTADGSSTNILLSGTLGYSLTPDTTVSFNVDYSKFDGGSEPLSTHEKAASVSLRKTF